MRRGDGERHARHSRRGHRAFARSAPSSPTNGPQKINICLTHLHLDHIEGLGFFAPFYDPDCEVSLWGPPSSVRTLKERISRYLSSPLFPVEVSDLPARVTFLDAPDGPWEIDGLRLHAHPVSHPGTTLGYRIESDGVAARVHPRSRAGARPRAGLAHQRLDLGVPCRGRRDAPAPRRAVHGGRVRRSGSAGATPRSRQTVTFAAEGRCRVDVALPSRPGPHRRRPRRALRARARALAGRRASARARTRGDGDRPLASR